MRTEYALLLISLTLSGCGVFSGGERSEARQQELEEAYQQYSRMISDGNFVFTVQSINPTGGRTMQATSTYTMRAEEGTYEANLPYFGRAYTAPYGSGGGIRFEGEPEDREIEKDPSKRTTRLIFSIGDVEISNEQYRVTLEISASGYGTLTVNSQNRQTISYYGKISGIQ